MATYRIDDLARAANTTVRNVRAFQERGVLPAPQRHGRIGLYDESHLARIRLIVQLQERGYTIATIAELISAWEHGRDLRELLGLEKVLTDPWSDEIPGHVTVAELAALFFPGRSRAEPAAIPADQPAHQPTDRPVDLPVDQPADLLARAEALGFVERAGDRYRVPSPRLLHVGAELAAAGVPLATVFDIADRLTDDCDTIARRFVQLTVDHAGLDDSTRNATRQDLPEVAEFIARLRPLALTAVQSLLARALQIQIEARLSDQIESMAQRPAPEQPAASGS